MDNLNSPKDILLTHDLTDCDTSDIREQITILLWRREYLASIFINVFAPHPRSHPNTTLKQTNNSLPPFFSSLLSESIAPSNRS